MDPMASAPDWLLRPLPVNAGSDANLLARIDELAARLPESLSELQAALDAVRPFIEYDAAANRTLAQLWPRVDDILLCGDVPSRRELLRFAKEHFPEAALARLLRRAARDAAPSVRRQAARILRKSGIREVALPGASGDWDQSGWLLPAGRPLSRHPQGRRAQQQHNVPVVATVGELRKLLGIRSSRQLGYFLLATDAEGGPYTSFTLPKRDGSERVICAPKRQLLWTQRTILEKILSKAPAHEAAHGFVPGRSTVTNATPHLGAKVLVKFDLKDFFPTISYYRVVGLFTRLGYSVEDARFGAEDDSRRVAATLARLCCYTPDPRAWHLGHAPQGAPTSPARGSAGRGRARGRRDGAARPRPRG